MEVFAVAAVGFVLKHDAQFKRNFLKNFAGIADGRENFQPGIQASDCEDLKLENPERRTLVVLEFKVWAPLQPKQNPWLDDRKPDDNSLPFWSEADNGYGYQLTKKDYDQIYYVVVQQKEYGGVRDEKPFEHSCKIFHLKRRNWECLLAPSPGLEEDLVTSLGELGIGELADWRMKTMKIKPETVEDCFKGAEVITGLLWVSEKLKLTLKKSWLGFGRNNLGVGLPNEVAARLSKGRSAFVGRHHKGWGCGWFGYISEQFGKFQPEVWFYCNTGAKDKLLKTLEREFQDASVEFPEPPESDDPSNCIRVRRSQDSLDPDGSWFCKALGIEGEK